MKVSGFTIVRNAIKFDYPVREAILSILPLCDEMIVSVGQSEDETLALIRSLNSPKIKIIQSVWDDSLREGGRVLAVETQKAFRAISPDADWAFYIQADEVLHEKYHNQVYETMDRWKNVGRVEGLLFDYLHFYGSYQYVGASRRWYRREVRIIRNDPSITSFRDAQGFRKNGKRLWVKHTGATMYHYGWVRPPAIQQARSRHFHRWWHPDEWVEQRFPDGVPFDYGLSGRLSVFTGTHPAVMEERVRSARWDFSYNPEQARSLPLPHRILNFIEDKTGWRLFEYRNYRLL